MEENVPEVMLRMHVTLASNVLPDLVCQLRAAGQAPKFFVYRREDAGGSGVIVMDFDHVNEPAAGSLGEWLRRIPGVLSVDFEWRPIANRGASS